MTISACNRSGHIEKSEPLLVQSGINTLNEYMTGSFNSALQAQLDSNYYNISLEMHPIWKDREGSWLYVEQALATKKAAPYRQRIYKVSYDRSTDTYISVVYKIPDEKNYIGKWKDDIFNALAAEDLILREGCDVILRQNSEGDFLGSTEEQNCLSTLRGASYATSKVNVYKDRIESWDQGFDDNGKQVWGAVIGPYIFTKINP